MTTTTGKGVPYPEETDANDVPVSLAAIANWVDAHPGVAAVTTAQRDALAGAELWDGRVILNLATGLLEKFNAGTTTWGAASVSDHGALTGLGDDDHPQYLTTARHDTPARHGATVVDHGSIGGLADDDHPQYLTNARGDARYMNVGEALTDAQLPARLRAGHINDLPGNDWNNATDPGWYASNIGANSPIDGTWFLGIVVAHTTDWVTQEVWAFTSATPGGQRFRRYKQNGAWNAWRQVTDETILLDARYATRTGGGKEAIASVGTTGTLTCDLNTASYFFTAAALTGAVTPAFTNVPSGVLATVQVEYPMGATPQTINLPTGGRWFGDGAPTNLANKTTLVTYQTRDGGTTWNCTAAVQA